MNENAIATIQGNITLIELVLDESVPPTPATTIKLLLNEIETQLQKLSQTKAPLTTRITQIPIR